MKPEELWTAYFDEIEKSKFSIIAAQLLLEEMDKEMTVDDLRDYKRRHARHIRTSNQHLRKAKRYRRKVIRIEEKARKANGG